jgi:predicted ArsR family transcriptional regulator
VITSGELAEMCRLSVNQMNRIVAKLEAGGYAKIVGSRAQAATGRPRRLISLQFGISV